MAFHWQTFRTRALTAVVFVAVMISGLLWNEWSFLLLFSLIHFGAWIEYQKLVELFHPPYRSFSSMIQFCFMMAGWSILLFFTNDKLTPGLSLRDAGVWTGILFLILLTVLLVFRSKTFSAGDLLYAVGGIIYISLPLGLLVDLRTRWIPGNEALSYSIPLLIIFSLWINDTMAYMVGSIAGRRPLSKISPKKTWEGTIGGIVLTVMAISGIAYYSGRLPVADAGVMSGMAAVAGTFGDLFESKLKRMARVKDSGSIMPGHGGFLDRFDSLLFAVAPVWVYAIWLFQH